MVKQCFLKCDFFSKGELVLAITAVVVAFSFSSNFALAAKTKISDEEVERVKTALDIVQTASNIGGILIGGGNIKTVLSTVIKGGQTATDVTYGLLVLSAINEMEFMDMVLSQAYKDEARDYFNQILNERTNLRSYWKGVGFDIPRVVSGRITSPMAALTLNTFEMTDKTVQIITEISVLRKEKQYDGLWYYFDLRKNGGEPHEIAWREAKIVMNWALEGTTRFKGGGSNNVTELEQRFLFLYAKWSPYATPYGISKEYKEQLASELRNILAAAAEENKNAFAEKEPSLWEKFTVQLASIKNAIANIVSHVKSPFTAGPVMELPIEIPVEPPAEIPADVGSPQAEIEKAAEDAPPPISDEVPENLDDILERVDIEPITKPTTTEPVVVEIKPKIEAASTTTEATIDVKEVRLPSIQLCARGEAGAPSQYRALINEVAWMGDQDSPNNEWIELKNVWGIPVNLNGWQIQDKDQQIKVIFDENDVIPASGYYLLERTDDDSLPDAPADKIYTGALSNSNEALYLFDNNCQLEDEIIANPDWPGGDNSLKKTMQRFDVLYWYTGAVSAGKENSSPPATLTHPSAPAPAPKAAASKPSFLKIIITETRTGSPGNEKDDFVELYNPNSEAVSLTDWYVQRKTETGQDFSSYAPAGLFSGKTIGANSYFLIVNASSTLATSTDILTTYALTENNTLVLKNPDGEIADQISTASPPSGKSYGRKWSTSTENYADNFENQKPTPKAKNQSSADEDEEGGENSILSVVINEIAWMGTKAKSQDEWIELYNNSTSSVDLTNWRLAADDGGPDITFSTSTIPAAGYFLIERTDDTAVNNVSADWFGSFGSGLSNNGEILKLYDNLGNLIDSVDAFSNWPAGDNQTKQTMERINFASSSDAVNWASNNRIARNGLDAGNNQINGTPKAQNSVSKQFTEVPTSLLIFDQDFTLTYLGSPYIMDGSIKVLEGVKLTIEPGVIIKFKENYYQHSLFTVEGNLEAVSVTFTSSSTNPSAGDWDGVYFKESAESKLENVIVAYAGKIHKSCCYEYAPYTNGAVKIQGGNVSIKNSVVERSQVEGLLVINSSPQINNVTFSNNNLNNSLTLDASAVFIGDANSAPVISSSTFTGNKIGIFIKNGAKPIITGNIFKDNGTPIKVEGAYPYFSSNSAQNNTNGDGIFFSGLISQDAVWQANLPYIVEYTLSIADGAKLTIASSTVVKFRGDSKMLINGTLLAQGEEENPILFTSITDSDPENNGGYYIYFNAPSKNSVLDHVIVRYGGYHINDFAGYKAAITIENTSSTISNSIIENNFFSGVYLINSASAIQNTIFRDNKVQYSWWGTGSYSRGLSILNSAPTITGSHFKRNYQGIYIEGSCPDLSGVSFGSGVDANAINVYPSGCQP